MKKKGRTIGRFLLMLVFIFSSVMLLRQFLHNRTGDEAHREALRLASDAPACVPTFTVPPREEGETVWIPAPVESDEHMQQLLTMDLAALREVNPDVVGWILIPDTAVNYPLVQGDDNAYYLDHAWNGAATGVGSIFLEWQNSPGLTDFNTILYGHNMINGTMFHDLREYARQDFWAEHPYVYLLSDAGVWRYEVFSSYKAPVTAITYNLDFRREQAKEVFLKLALEESVIETGISPAVTDRILTLSTCDGSGVYSHRWVVHARLKMTEA